METMEDFWGKLGKLPKYKNVLLKRYLALRY